MIDDRACNVYCTETEHCDIVYITRADEAHQVAAAYHYRYGVKVTRMEPASEAPDIEQLHPGALRQIGAGGPAEDGTRLLVWWQ